MAAALPIPALAPVNYPGNVTGGKIMRRLEYPAQEKTINPHFYENATLPDDFMTRVWWDIP